MPGKFFSDDVEFRAWLEGFENKYRVSAENCRQDIYVGLFLKNKFSAIAGRGPLLVFLKEFYKFRSEGIQVSDELSSRAFRRAADYWETEITEITEEGYSCRGRVLADLLRNRAIPDKALFDLLLNEVQSEPGDYSAADGRFKEVISALLESQNDDFLLHLCDRRDIYLSVDDVREMLFRVGSIACQAVSEDKRRAAIRHYKMLINRLPNSQALCDMLRTFVPRRTASGFSEVGKTLQCQAEEALLEENEPGLLLVLMDSLNRGSNWVFPTPMELQVLAVSRGVEQGECPKLSVERLWDSNCSHRIPKLKDHKKAMELLSACAVVTDACSRHDARTALDLTTELLRGYAEGPTVSLNEKRSVKRMIEYTETFTSPGGSRGNGWREPANLWGSSVCGDSTNRRFGILAHMHMKTLCRYADQNLGTDCPKSMRMVAICCGFREGHETAESSLGSLVNFKCGDELFAIADHGTTRRILDNYIKNMVKACENKSQKNDFIMYAFNRYRASQVEKRSCFTQVTYFFNRLLSPRYSEHSEAKIKAVDILLEALRTGKGCNMPLELIDACKTGRLGALLSACGMKIHEQTPRQQVSTAPSPRLGAM